MSSEKKEPQQVNTALSNALFSAVHARSQCEVESALKKYSDSVLGSINGTNKDGDTPLHIAASPKPMINKGDINIVQKLIAAKANVNAVGKGGVTPLLDAVVAGSPSIVQALVDAGANVNATDNRGQTPSEYTKLMENKQLEAILLGTARAPKPTYR